MPEPAFIPVSTYRGIEHDRDGYNRYGYNRDGYNRDGYNLDGYDRNSHHRDGYDRYGYDINGYSRDGYNRNNYDRNGYNRDGYNRIGYDRDGYNRYGYDRYGYNRNGFDGNGYSRDGHHRDGYNEDGYDINGYNRSGFDADGYNRNGFNADGFDNAGYDAHGYDADGYDEDGYNEDGYDENGYDQNGYNEDGYDRDGEHKNSRCCSSPQQTFAIRNNGAQPLANDTRATISLAADVISDEGVAAITRLLQKEARTSAHRDKFTYLIYNLPNLDSKWQTPRGNYPKRLSSLAFKEHQLKLSPDILSQVGLIARNHSTPVNFDIEITRKLNLPAGDFCNEDSCWWTDYSYSRCALKTNGGFALRTFNSYGVTGRAWVMPLKLSGNNKTLLPTFDTESPAAFITFNGYGDLSNYTPARILSHMAGWTYRKTGFDCEPMYINAGGYLIAPEVLAEHYTDGCVSLSVSRHSHLFATEKNGF